METRDLIIETAFLAFIDSGYGRVSLNEIVRRTGLTKGAFYHYFTSKSDLVQAVMKQYFFAHITKTIEAVEVSGRSFNEKIMRIYRNVLNINIQLVHYPHRIIERSDFMQLFQEFMTIDDQMKKLGFEQQHNTIILMEKAIIIGQSSGEISGKINALELAELINATVRGTMVASNYLSELETENKLKQNMALLMALISL